jgi:transposase InsO family protein
VDRDFTADAPGVKMVGDITYIPTWQGRLYLATVIDCHTKELVGWAMDDSYKTADPAGHRDGRARPPARRQGDLPLRPRQQLHIARVREDTELFSALL